MEPLARVTDATCDVLHVLLEANDPVWGLVVIRESGRPAGTVYPVLDRLERAGWLTSEWERDVERSGPRRRYYTLTADGAVAAREAVARRRPASSGRIAGGAPERRTTGRGTRATGAHGAGVTA